MTVYRRGGLIEEDLSHSIIGAFFRVYNTLGFGFLESVYTLALERELCYAGLKVAREVSVPVYYNEDLLTYHRVDMLVADRVVVEIKSTEVLHKGAPRQVYNYLRATNLELGLLLHFGREAKFYRVICQHPLSRQIDSLNSPNPENS